MKRPRTCRTIQSFNAIVSGAGSNRYRQRQYRVTIVTESTRFGKVLDRWAVVEAHLPHIHRTIVARIKKTIGKCRIIAPGGKLF